MELVLRYPKKKKKTFSMTNSSEIIRIGLLSWGHTVYRLLCLKYNLYCASLLKYI